MANIATPSGRKMKPLPKILLLVTVTIGVIKGAQFGISHGYIPAVGIAKALIPEKAALPDLREAVVQDVTPLPFPSKQTASVPAPLFRAELWAWNAQINYLYANGGPQTTKSSLMEKYGVNLSIARQDDTGQMQNDLLACANQLKNGSRTCDSGANFVFIMGDGSGQFFAAINPQLKKLGPDYYAEVIGSTGYSRGEDKLMGLPEWRNNPQSAKGSLISGVLRDGDWDIAMKWASDNQIKNNPDEKTYDADALNWVNASDFIKAAEAYNSNYCEDRKVVKNGTPTGETKNVCVNGVVTWTPGDVNIAHGRGGLVSIVSSKQYRSQMPDVIIGIHKFDQDNRHEVEGMLAATFSAGDQLKAFPDALRRAAEVSAVVYSEQNADYWLRYFKGTQETDHTGQTVELGGSAVNNLADNLILFGLEPGTNNNFRSTYTTFGNIAMQQYPSLFEGDHKVPPANQISDTSYILGAQSAIEQPSSQADVAEFSGGGTGQVVSKRGWNINFDTGQATLTPDGERTMHEIRDDLAIASGLYVTLDGYTDNTGSHETNVDLSKRRALAVKQWLQAKAPVSFPDRRFRLEGHGEANAVASNATADGRARNRRVEITLSE